MANPDIIIPVRLRHDHLAAIKAAISRAEALERELNDLISNAVFEVGHEPRPEPETFPLAVMVDGGYRHSITFATRAERDAYCAGFYRADRIRPVDWFMVVPENFGAYEFDADTTAQVRTALGIK